MKATRHGKHRDGNVLLGAMVAPKRKAIAIVTAAVMAGNGNKLTQSDIVWKGIENLAIMAGVLDVEGRVTTKYADAVSIAEANVVNGNISNRGTRGGMR